MGSGFVLIIVMLSSGHESIEKISFQEFSTAAKCENAKKEIIYTLVSPDDAWKQIFAKCVEK